MNRNHRKTARAGVLVTSLVMLGVVLANAMPAAAVDFANPAFKRVWDRTDALVASGQVSRTWFWGPEPRAAAQEQYVDAPSGTGTRLVQYFDKSRMEINNPGADPNSTFYVTNGLLTVELISGQMQIGDNAFVERYPANIAISGDVDDAQAPTYASFISVSNTRRADHPQPNRTGLFATGTINKAGQVGDDPSKANLNSAKIAYFDPTTRHNIPDIFWQFLNATGPISETGQIVNKRLIDPWFYASGLPISDAYWTRVKINGVANVEVLIQAYERRVLTYVPTNVPGFQVEMGNIGLHYYDWRYKDAGKPTGTVVVPATATITGTTTVVTPTATLTPTMTATGTVTATAATPTGTPPTMTPTPTSTPNVVTQGVIVFASDRSGNREVYRVRGDGTGLTPSNLSNNPQADDYPAISPDFTKIAFASTRDGDEEIYVMNADGSGQLRLTNSPGSDRMPAWSPDGSKIVFVSMRSGQEDVWIMNSNGTNPVNVTFLAGPDLDPHWGANNKIVFTSRRTGSWQVWTVNPDGTELYQATQTGNNFQPRWNYVANRIVFVSDRDGNDEIYTMRSGGEEQFRLTNNNASDREPAYSPDNSRIVFSSDRVDAANRELYTMRIDGTNQERITIQAGFDGHPTWGLLPAATARLASFVDLDGRRR